MKKVYQVSAQPRHVADAAGAVSDIRFEAVIRAESKSQAIKRFERTTGHRAYEVTLVGV